MPQLLVPICEALLQRSLIVQGDLHLKLLDAAGAAREERQDDGGDEAVEIFDISPLWRGQG